MGAQMCGGLRREYLENNEIGLEVLRSVPMISSLREQHLLAEAGEIA